MSSKRNIPNKNYGFPVSKAIFYSLITIISIQFVGAIIASPTLLYPPLNHILLPLSFLGGTLTAIIILMTLTETKFSTVIENLKNPFSFSQLVLAILSWFFFLPLVEFFTSLVPIDGPFEQLYKTFESSFEIMLNYKIAGFITVCILAPIFEEIIFRGIILKGMLNYKVKPGIAIFISAFIFGIAHLNPWQFIGAGILGFIFGFVFYKTKSLILPILLHFFNNILSYVIMLKYGDSELNIFNIENYILVASMTFLGIISMIILQKKTN